MSRKQIWRMAVDLAMTVILLLLMGYSRIGETAHEVLGVCMFTLFILHHILNRKWIAGIFKGKYSAYRIFQTVLVALLFVTMTGSAVSGIILSKHLFNGLEFGGTSVAREVHMLCGYWNFVLMSLHLGLHWSMILGMTGKKIPIKKPAVKWLLRILGSVIAVYGIYALTQRQMHEYLFGITMFAFIDESERIVFFLMDYLAIMGLFVFVSHYISTGLRYFIRGGANKNAGKNVRK